MLSIQQVITNDDLLTEILLGLPVKSLFRFKCVSKHWHALISNPHFSFLRNPNPEFPSTIICPVLCFNNDTRDEQIDNYNTCLFLIPLVNNEKSRDGYRLETIIDIPYLSRIHILSSCNGLLLCRDGFMQARHHILNPTTNQFETLPEPDHNWLEGLGLLYDPAISHHYEVVGILEICNLNSCSCQIKIYSSKTKKWRDSGERFTINAIRMYLSGGVYWNGAINWLNAAAEPIYFNIDEERVGFMPVLPIPLDNIWYGHYYFGESHGHLHFVDFLCPKLEYNVYEMKKDYTEWVVTYRVDLAEIATKFPKMTQPGRVYGNCHCSYSVIYVAGEKNDHEGSFMVLYVPGKFLRYNFVDKSYKIIYEYDSSTLPEQRGDLLTAYPYIESLFSI